MINVWRYFAISNELFQIHSDSFHEDYIRFISSLLYAAALRCSSGARRLNSHLVLPAFKPLSLERGRGTHLMLK